MELEQRGELVSFDELIYKWLRCELVHRGRLPVDARFYEPGKDPGHLNVRGGGSPEHTVLLSQTWYWWLRKMAEHYVNKVMVYETGTQCDVIVPPGALITHAIGAPEDQAVRQSTPSRDTL